MPCAQHLSVKQDCRVGIHKYMYKLLSEGEVPTAHVRTIGFLAHSRDLKHTLPDEQEKCSPSFEGGYSLR